MTSPIPFSLITAFSNSSFGGNPAAVAFLDLNLPDDVLQKVAKNFNQPIASYVSPAPLPSKDEKIVTFGIRWFASTGLEAPLCGHGTIAAAKAVFERRDLVSDKVEVVEFQTLTAGVMRARKLEGGVFEIQLPSTRTEEVSVEERDRLAPLFYKAFGREVEIKYIGKGGKGFEHALMVELDEKENLKACKVDPEALRTTGYVINVVTTASSSGNEVFVSRMFSPLGVEGGEDPVCGSAHCLIGPYWYGKQGIPARQEIKAKQVSPRGGDLKLVWDEEEGNIKLRGELAIIATGELQL